MGFWGDIWQREFSRDSIRARINRRRNMSEIKFRLDYWADYGNPDDAEEAIRLIREAM